MSKPLPLHETATRYWWIRHAPVTHLKHVMYGSEDVEADVSDTARFSQLAGALPAQAIWYTSHLQRTHQTADAVAGAGLDCGERLTSELIGEMDFGDMTGKTHGQLIDERDEPFIGFWPVSPLQTEIPGGESFADVVHRVGQFMEHCNEQHRGEDVICYSHMGTILAALSVALELPEQSRVSMSIDNLTITRIHHYPGLLPSAPRYRVYQMASR